MRASGWRASSHNGQEWQKAAPRLLALSAGQQLGGASAPATAALCRQALGCGRKGGWWRPPPCGKPRTAHAAAAAAPTAGLAAGSVGYADVGRRWTAARLTHEGEHNETVAAAAGVGCAGGHRRRHGGRTGGGVRAADRRALHIPTHMALTAGSTLRLMDAGALTWPAAERVAEHQRP